MSQFKLPMNFSTYQRTLLGLAMCGSLVCVQAGCVNTMVMMSKVLLGDPVQVSSFQLGTGVNLVKDKKQVLLHVTTPPLLAEEYSRLDTDVSEELLRRMRRHKIQVMHPDTAAKVLDQRGGAFDSQVLAREVENCDYIMHVQLERFTLFEGSTTSFYRGKATGTITAYEVRKDGDSSHAVQVYEQRFSSTYPNSHPIAVDSTPENVFVRRFIDSLADNLGNAFYDVNRSELYAN